MYVKNNKVDEVQDLGLKLFKELVCFYLKSFQNST